jgi:ATP-dependent DNA helicase 2 subunit 2
MLLLDRPLQRTQSHVTSSSKAKAADSDTEEDDEDLLPNDKPGPVEPDIGNSNRNMLPTPARSMSPHIDPGRALGRIIGSTYPLADFQKNMAQGDVVSKAVEDLSVVITEIVMKPFTSRRTGELLECMKELREVCLKVGDFCKMT